MCVTVLMQELFAVRAITFNLQSYILKDECPVDALRACVFIYLPYILKNNVEFRRNNIMNTKPCQMSSHNNRIIILIYTKDCSDTEGYKNQTNFVAQKMAASEVLSAQCINSDTHPLS